jgi:sugar lactone lactonase YvrE
VISTVAGNGIAGYSGDGGPATSAMLSHPTGVAVDAAGDLFIADTGNNRVRVVDPSGVISTAAGNGVTGYSGDGGPATSAALFQPSGVAVDAAGNLFIADSANQRVRRVDPSGVISTVAGNGRFGYSGDGGPATSASLNSPYGVTVDAAGDLFIADAANLRIREVDPSGVISTVAGNGSQGYLSGYSGDGAAATGAQLYRPNGLALDAAGDLFIADSLNNRVRRVDPSGVISTVAGNGSYGFSGDGGLATNARLTSPSGVAVDAAGDLFIADTFNNRVRKVDPSGVISTVAGNGVPGYSGDGGPATSAALFQPFTVVVDGSGNLFIADSFNHRIRKVDPSGVITTVAGNGTAGYSGDGGPATAASLNYPYSVALDAAGDLFIADYFNDRVRKVNPSGMISTVAGNGTHGYSGDGGLATSAALAGPVRVAVDAAGNLFIADGNNNRLRKVDSNGMITTVAGNGIQGYSGDGGPATSASLTGPSGVAVDAGGNLFLSDAYNAVIRKVSVATTLLVTAPATVTAGDTFSVTVTAVEDDGSTDTGYTGTVTLGLGMGSLTHTFTSADAGSFTFTGVQLFIAGTQTLTASDGTLSGGAVVMVVPGAAVSLLLSGPSQVQAGIPFTVTVTAYDAWGNVATGYTGTVHFTSDDTMAVLPADSTFAGGIQTFSITLNTPGARQVAVNDTADPTLMSVLPVTVL